MAITMHRSAPNGSERPYPGQIWRCAEAQVIMVIAVSPTTVTYDNLSRGGRATESLDVFTTAYRRLKR